MDLAKIAYKCAACQSRAAELGISNFAMKYLGASSRYEIVFVRTAGIVITLF
jgi:hypothetical protein